MLLAVLALLLLVIFKINYFFSKKDILSPGCVFALSFLLITVIAFFGGMALGIDIAFSTVLIIAIYSLVFSAGCLLSTIFFPVKKSHQSVRDFVFLKIPKKRITIIMFALSCALTVFIYANVIRNAALYFAATGTTGSIVSGARSAYFSGLSQKSFLSSIANVFIFGLCYVCLFYFMISKVILGKRIKDVFYLLLPVFPYLIACFLSTGRTQFVSLFFYILVLYWWCLKKSKSNKAANKNLLKIATIMLVVGGVLFFAYGFIRASKTINDLTFSSILETVNNYSGMSILNFDYYLNHAKVQNQIFGQYTLGNFREMLEIIGFRFPDVANGYAAPPIGSGTSNIFSGLRRLIDDYSFFGTGAILFFGGFLITCLYTRVFDKKCNTLMAIMFLIYYCPLFEIAIEERLISAFGITPIIRLVALWLIIFTLNKGLARKTTKSVSGTSNRITESI